MYKLSKCAFLLLFLLLAVTSNAYVHEMYSCTQSFMGNTCNIYDRIAEGCYNNGACSGSGEECDFWIGTVEHCTTGTFYRDYSACNQQ